MDVRAPLSILRSAGYGRIARTLSVSVVASALPFAQMAAQARGKSAPTKQPSAPASARWVPPTADAVFRVYEATCGAALAEEVEFRTEARSTSSKDWAARDSFRLAYINYQHANWRDRYLSLADNSAQIRQGVQQTLETLTQFFNGAPGTRDPRGSPDQNRTAINYLGLCEQRAVLVILGGTAPPLPPFVKRLRAEESNAKFRAACAAEIEARKEIYATVPAQQFADELFRLWNGSASTEQDLGRRLADLTSLQTLASERNGATDISGASRQVRAQVTDGNLQRCTYRERIAQVQARPPL